MAFATNAGHVRVIAQDLLVGDGLNGQLTTVFEAHLFRQNIKVSATFSATGQSLEFGLAFSPKRKFHWTQVKLFGVMNFGWPHAAC